MLLHRTVNGFPYQPGEFAAMRDKKLFQTYIDGLRSFYEVYLCYCRDIGLSPEEVPVGGFARFMEGSGWTLYPEDKKWLEK